MSNTHNPYSQWFWNDWSSDPGVRACSFAARGFWMELLSIAGRATPRGYVLINGRKPTEPELARATGATLQEVKTLLAELHRHGVYSMDRKGVIYSRRMIREEKKRAASAKGGKKGGPASLENKTGIHATRDDTRGSTREDTRTATPTHGARPLPSPSPIPYPQVGSSSESSKNSGARTNRKTTTAIANIPREAAAQPGRAPPPRAQAGEQKPPPPRPWIGWGKSIGITQIADVFDAGKIIRDHLAAHEPPERRDLVHGATITAIADVIRIRVGSPAARDLIAQHAEQLEQLLRKPIAASVCDQDPPQQTPDRASLAEAAP
jgi:hypothetical protein